MSYGAVPQNNSPYGNSNPGYAESSTGFITPHSTPKKKGLSPWIKFGVPVLLAVIIAAVVGGVLGTRKKDSDSSSSSGSGSSGDKDATVDSKAPIATATNILAAGVFATATNSKYMIPLYPSATNTALFASATIDASNTVAWPKDTFAPSNPSPTNVREDRPRIIAPQYKWDALPDLIRNDPYLSKWNDTIIQNATVYAALRPVQYFMDGDSGILDNAREVKMRIKAFGYAYRVTGNTKWGDRAWEELQNAISDSFGPTNNTKWNPSHFLDAAEFSAAFGIAYDWFYPLWTDDQKKTIRDGLITYGLQHGVDVYAGGTDFGWWTNNITGNWNCVCNGGLTLGALAILGDDTTGVATSLLGSTIDNAKANCALAVMDDGSWAESPNYWYFGTTGHAEMVSALITATGSDYGLMSTANTNYWRTGDFHMGVFGVTSLFDYGDHGPNKFSTTANSMILYGDLTNHPEFILHQRDRADAAEPWSMFWYDPQVEGAYWTGRKLDYFYDNSRVQWASMRGSWTDDDAVYLAIKAGQNLGHQTHNDLDVGTFVLDALGTRWAGELGSGDYRSPQYFSSQAQDAERWKYYRKATVGQNTLVVNTANQNVNSEPTVTHGSSETAQGSSTVLTVPKDSTAFWVADITSAYFDASSVKRGARLLNGRRQVLIQDEITATQAVQWRMHTNATVTPDGTSATLKLDGQTLKITMLDPPSGVSFKTMDPVRLTGMPEPLVADQENPGVTVLAVDLPSGTSTLRVLFNPQWEDMKDADYVTPPNVDLDSWTLRSHD